MSRLYKLNYLTAILQYGGLMAKYKFGRKWVIAIPNIYDIKLIRLKRDILSHPAMIWLTHAHVSTIDLNCLNDA